MPAKRTRWRKEPANRNRLSGTANPDRIKAPISDSIVLAASANRFMKYYLIVANKGKNQGLPIPIKVDLFLIGSDRMCQVRSAMSGIGSQHCAIVSRERKVVIRDLSSGYDTIVNGAPLPEGAEWPLH